MRINGMLERLPPTCGNMVSHSMKLRVRSLIRFQTIGNDPDHSLDERRFVTFGNWSFRAACSS